MRAEFAYEEAQKHLRQRDSRFRIRLGHGGGLIEKRNGFPSAIKRKQRQAPVVRSFGTGFSF